MEFLNELLDFSDVATSVGALDVAISMILAFILTLILTETYKLTHRGTTYSQQLLFTMIIMSLSVSVIMLIIGSNIARAFSLVGALSIIRFRNPIKESRDISYIFYCSYHRHGYWYGVLYSDNRFYSYHFPRFVDFALYILWLGICSQSVVEN